MTNVQEAVKTAILGLINAADALETSSQLGGGEPQFGELAASYRSRASELQQILDAEQRVDRQLSTPTMSPEERDASKYLSLKTAGRGVRTTVVQVKDDITGKGTPPAGGEPGEPSPPE